MPRFGLSRLVLVTVLAGLLHMLGCAHGPQAAGLPRPDTLAAVTAAAPHGHADAPADVAAGEDLCSHGAGAGCGVDEPAAAGPRADLPAPEAEGGLVLSGCGAWWQALASQASCAAGPGGHHAGHTRTRAALGIWRA
ncbi:hypothetical protein [Streptomyces sp. NBC_00059]|uniref:hypothetical protein n=1 Tax=Streptomyces sp. NBC_00059 TaxID=2975635 RepID=UPI0022550984|nr:hypothetical protein [Streptomyces sp. NBC_00059]MCX5418062.1 hypothetical protein [Streptomyces sp. NBC_00059]